MQAIDYLLNWTRWLLILIPVGAGATVTYFAFSKSLSLSEEHIRHCNTRIVQTIKGAVIGMTISGLITLIRQFYS